MPPSDELERPATLHVAIALAALTGLANILVGAAVLILLLVGVLPNTPGLSTITLVTIGVAYPLLGALTMAGAFGLLEQRAGSRALVTVLMMLRIVVASVTFGAIGGAWYASGSVVGAVVALIVITLLWDSRANAYFHTTR